MDQQPLAVGRDETLALLAAHRAELETLKAVVEATDDSIVTWSPAGVVTSWNRGAERLYGYARDEALGRQIVHFLPPDEHGQYRETLALVEQGQQGRLHTRALSRDGSVVEVEASISAVRDETGAVLAYVGISHDVTERSRLQQELAAHARRLDEAQQLARFGSWEWHLDRDTVVASRELRRIFGLQEDGPLSMIHFLERAHPEDAAVVTQLVRSGNDLPLDYETRIVRPDGEVRWISVRGTTQTDETGRPTRKLGTVQDVTERKLTEQVTAATIARLDEAQRLAGVGSFERDVRTGRDTWSHQLYRILGADPDTPPSYQSFLDTIHPEDREIARQQNRDAGPDHPMEYEVRVLPPDGEIRWVRVHVEVVESPNGSSRSVRGTVLDITAGKQAQVALERLALTDGLTGLPNRTRFDQMLRSALADAGKGDQVGVLMLDLDGFKDVNDSLGHDAGDLVLKEVARRVSAVLRGDELARLGGDEFAVVLPQVGGVEDAVAVATRIRAAFEPAFDLEGVPAHVGVSIGVVVSREAEPATLLKQADMAMYRAKELETGWAIFRSDQDDVAAERQQMVSDLRESLKRGELHVAYQPLIDLRTRAVNSFEALARWQHPDWGAVPPDRFIPLAEQADLIEPLTRLVLRQAAAACACWRSAGHDVRVAVNLSMQVIESVNAAELVAEELATAGLDPQHLVLEITESSVATDADQMQQTLRALRELGTSLVIDDFGTGYSAMSYLKGLPAEGLKIDRSFVRDIASDSRDLAIVRSLVRLAHSLSLSVVAEGVESRAALELLAGLGCDLAQGYDIARPMTESDVERWITRYERTSSRSVLRREPTQLLIVDDSAAVRTHLARLATQAGWQVRQAASAEDALAELDAGLPDVVVLDHVMSGMSGMEAVPIMRASGLDGPILLFTDFLSEAMPAMRVPLDVWPVSKRSPEAVLELLDGYRSSGV